MDAALDSSGPRRFGRMSGSGRTGGISTRRTTSTGFRGGGGGDLDESLHLERFGENIMADDVDMQTVRSGVTQGHKSLVDIFLADDKQHSGDENDVVDMVSTGKGKKCRTILMWLGVIVVIGIIFVTVPKGGLGFGGSNNEEEDENPTLAFNNGTECNVPLDGNNKNNDDTCIPSCLGQRSDQNDTFVCDITADWLHHVGGTDDWYPATPPTGTGLHQYVAYQGGDSPPCHENGHCPGCDFENVEANEAVVKLCTVWVDSEDCSIKCSNNNEGGEEEEEEDSKEKQTQPPGVHQPEDDVNVDTSESVNLKQSRHEAVQAYVLDKEVSLEEALDDPKSPQSLAVKWISETDPAELNIPGYAHNKDHSAYSSHIDEDDQDKMGRMLLQRYTMVVLYYTMSNETTTNASEENEGRRQRHLLTRQLQFVAPPTQDELDFRYQFDHWLVEGSDTCEWYGVECNDQDEIVALHLSKCLLEGALPRELFQPNSLPELTTLDVSYNRLTGLEDNEAVALPQLQQLHVQENQQWQGGLAPFLDVSTLKVLDLSATQSSERLPGDWSDLSNLESISMSDSNVHGTLPTSWGSLTKLHTIDLNGNELTGSIPDEWSSLSNLQYLKLGHNPIDGTIPEFIGENMPHMKHISLQDTNLNGLLPSTSLAKLQQLEELHLHRTYVRGTMPEEFCDLVDDAKLRVLTSDCDDADPHTDPRIICSCCTKCYPHHSRRGLFSFLR